MSTSAAYIELTTGIYKVLDIDQYGEDEMDGLVLALLERIDQTDLVRMTVLAEDIRVHADAGVAAIGAMLWRTAKDGG